MIKKLSVKNFKKFREKDFIREFRFLFRFFLLWNATTWRICDRVKSVVDVIVWTR